MIHEGAGAVVDSLTGDCHIVGIHYAMNEADMHPAGNERRLFVAHGRKQGEVGVRVVLQLRVVTIDYVIGQATHLGLLTAGSEQLKGADTDVAGSNARQNRARQRTLAKDGLACDDRGERPGLSGYRARASLRRSDIHATLARVLPGRRRRAKRGWDPNL